MMLASTALYGPQAAALVELFPTRIRYTALSVPYNIGTGWVGGLLPVSAFALVAANGDIYAGLLYPLVFTADQHRLRSALPARNPRHRPRSCRQAGIKIQGAVMTSPEILSRRGFMAGLSAMAAASRIGYAAESGRANAGPIIDVHAHFQPAILKALGMPGPMDAWNLQKHLDDMGAAGVTRSMLSDHHARRARDRRARPHAGARHQ